MTKNQAVKKTAMAIRSRARWGKIIILTLILTNLSKNPVELS